MSFLPVTGPGRSRITHPMAMINDDMYDACNDDEVIASSRGRITHTMTMINAGVCDASQDEDVTGS